MNHDFMAALEAIEKEKGIKKETLFEAIEAALISAYKRNFNSAHNVRVVIKRETGDIKVYSCLNVVGSVTNPQQEILIDEARREDPLCEVGDVKEIEVTPKNFGRIAAQTAKQVVIQRIREAERELVYEDFIDRVDDIITGVVQRFEQKNAIINVGKTEAILTPSEQIQGETYKQGDRIKVYITEVKKTTKGPQVFVSRSHPGLLKRLFELEVPEIYNGVVEIKSVAREPGYRSKIAVCSLSKDVDPVGACVGPKGSRVQAIVGELRGEKIDIIEWNDHPEVFVASSLSPSKVVKVEIMPESKSATVIVPDYQLSLAIGKEGQNARLAAKLTSWKIDIVSESKYSERKAEEKAAESLTGQEEEEAGEEDTLPVTEAVTEAPAEDSAREDEQEAELEGLQISTGGGDQINYRQVEDEGVEGEQQNEEQQNEEQQNEEQQNEEQQNEEQQNEER